MKRWFSIVAMGVYMATGVCFAQSDRAAEHHSSSLAVLTKVYSPFSKHDRNSYQQIEQRIFSRFGVYRTTPKKGHRHAGIDLRGSFGEKVFAIGPGVVVRDYWIFPNRAVAVQHRLVDGSSIYSAYVHIEDIKVREGQLVDETTELGRVFTQAEMGRARYRSPPHLHLEIRRSMADDGRRSFSSMTISALEEYCLNPESFIRPRMR